MRHPAPEERVEDILDQAEQAMDAGEPDRALELCDAAQAILPDHPGAWYVRGDALRTLGDLEEAARAYRAAALGRPDHAACWSALALTCFDLLRFDEAARAASRALREDPHDAEAWWVKGLVREWKGDLPGARRCEAHAYHLAPEAYPLPPELSDEEIEALVTDALLVLPEAIRDYLADVAIVLDEIPDAETCAWYEPPASPVELLGYFSGTSLLDRSMDDPWSQVPGTIVLFRRNLARRSATRDELIEQLRITLFHEVGHFLGLDEDEVADRGLE